MVIKPHWLLVVFLTGCNPWVSDSDKLEEFNQRCAEYSSEYITPNSAMGSVNLWDGAWGLSGKIASIEGLIWNSQSNIPIGSAKLPALDLEYDPKYLLKTLFIEPDALKEVRFTFNYKVGNSQIQQCHKNQKAIVIKSFEDADSPFRDLCDKEQTDDRLARYTILYAYGEVDKYDIRPFMFWINDRETSRILAQQVSFQLLMGGFSGNKKILLGMGGLQGVKTCRLTPPDQLVKAVWR